MHCPFAVEAVSGLVRHSPISTWTGCTDVPVSLLTAATVLKHRTLIGGRFLHAFLSASLVVASDILHVSGMLLKNHTTCDVPFVSGELV